MIDKTHFNAFKPAYGAAGERQTLPAGIYEGHICDATVDASNGFQTLILYVEIDQGEYANFYHQDYEAQKNGLFSSDAKYRGRYRIQLPDGQNTEHDNWRQHALEGAVWAIEDGNPGFRWDWDETKLKGKKVGLNVREREYYYNGRSGVTTEIGRLESVTQMHNPDERKRPKPMWKRELSASDKARRDRDQAVDNGYVEVTDEELPWSRG